MKTTVEISDALLVAAKERAATERRPLRALIEAGIRLELVRRPKSGKRTRRGRRLVTVPSKLPPGLDVSDRAVVYDWLLKNR